MQIAFGSALAILLGIGVVSHRALSASAESERLVRHTHNVLGHLQELHMGMEVMSSSIRRYVLTEEDSNLETYRQSASAVDREVAAVRGLTADNPVQQSSLTILERLVAARVQRGIATVDQRRNGGLEAAIATIRSGSSLADSVTFASISQRMREEELRLLTLREASAKGRLSEARVLLNLGIIFGLLITGAAGWIVKRDSSRRARAEDILFQEKERAQITLASVGDAVACTNIAGNITYLNAAAEKMSGWSCQDATGQPMAKVLQILESTTRETIPNPMELAIAQNRSMHLPPNSVLIRRDGFETPIEDSVAPIHDRQGRAIGAIIVFRDVTVARAIALQTAHAAEHDFLTGLPNRMLLNDRVNQAIAVAPRHMKQVAILFLDLDGFKHVNDTLGHAVGDKLLQSVARRLVDCVRGSDTVSRQGGDEFVVLLTEVRQLEDAAITATRMLEAVARPHIVDQHELHLTTSIGVSVYPDDGMDAETLIKNADIAMYQAKDNGRQGYRFFEPAMIVRSVERQSIEKSLRSALERRELSLHYQPKIDLRTGGITGAEALIRWTHPTRGSVSPAQFISIAEACGLMVPIGAWVMREACMQARAWIDAGLTIGTMAVNVTALEFLDDSFLQSVFAILEATGLDARLLELDLTEGALMKNAESTAAILKALRARGIRVALDDFGTGHSSLSHLQKFPVDALKIDQSFVRQISTPGEEAAMVITVIGMARSLKLRVVAEGVETLEEMAFLQAHHCDEAQGYYFSRPMAPEPFTKLLETGVAKLVVAA